MYRVKSIILIFSLIINCPAYFSVHAKELDKRKLYSLAAAAIDCDSGRVLYDKNGYEERAMASTTKIMTLILALEFGNLEDTVTISSYASKMPDVQLGICKGEQYKLKDLLYSLILESHNDTAVAIAEHISGTKEKFAELMNKKAVQIGLKNTYFITPNGLDAKDQKSYHHTTAVDLAKLMKYCSSDSSRKDNFIKICQTKQYSFSDKAKKRHFNVYNKNAFLDMYEGVLCGKTGFTCDAGYCYVCTVKRGDKCIAVAFLGAGWPNHKNYKWIDSRTLLDYIFLNYEKRKILDESYKINSIYVDNGIESDYIEPYINQSLNILTASNDEIILKEELVKKIRLPLYKNDKIGKLQIIINNDLIYSFDIYSNKTIHKIKYSDYLIHIIKKVIECR